MRFYLKEWNLWRSPAKNTLFSYSKNLVRNLNSNSNGFKSKEKPKTSIGANTYKDLLLKSTVFVDKRVVLGGVSATLQIAWTYMRVRLFEQFQIIFNIFALIYIEVRLTEHYAVNRNIYV
jgi:hypothetical protein